MKTLSNIKNIAALAFLSISVKAHAQSGGFALPELSDFFCTLLAYLRGDLAVMIFVLVTALTIIVGFFAKMDWTKILTIVILFGLLQGMTKLFSGFLKSSLSCLT